MMRCDQRQWVSVSGSGGAGSGSGSAGSGSGVYGQKHRRRSRR
ncbi:hypothetical protein [Paenibacillus sp. FSL L8-0494]